MGRWIRIGAVDGGSPTLELVVLIVLVFLAQQSLAIIGFGLEMVALAFPLAHRPWTIVTSVYTHGSPQHLMMNAIALAVFGLLIERHTTRWRFHGFVLGTGALAGIAEIAFGGLLGGATLVLGISGAVFGLMGYLVSANPVTTTVLGVFRPSRRVQLALVLVLAVATTVLTAAEGVALVAHFTGFVIGLIAGRMRLLRV